MQAARQREEAERDRKLDLWSRMVGGEVAWQAQLELDLFGKVISPELAEKQQQGQQPPPPPQEQQRAGKRKQKKGG